MVGLLYEQFEIFETVAVDPNDGIWRNAVDLRIVLSACEGSGILFDGNDFFPSLG